MATPSAPPVVEPPACGPPGTPRTRPAQSMRHADPTVAASRGRMPIRGARPGAPGDLPLPPRSRSGSTCDMAFLLVDLTARAPPLPSGHYGDHIRTLSLVNKSDYELSESCAGLPRHEQHRGSPGCEPHLPQPACRRPYLVVDRDRCHASRRDRRLTDLAGRKVLVTGGTGFPGANLVRELARALAEVVGIGSEDHDLSCSRLAAPTASARWRSWERCAPTRSARASPFEKRTCGTGTPRRRTLRSGWPRRCCSSSPRRTASTTA